MIEEFGTLPTGETVHRLRLEGGGLTGHILTYGAILQDLRLEGHDAPLVLGFPEFAPYLTHSPYFGAIAGRCANRIRDGHLELDGQTFQLDRNFIGKHSLHGGAVSMGKQLWAVVDYGSDHATLEITLPDGHMGYPGNLTVKVHFTLLEGGVLDIRMEAESDAPTLCNLAHHSYFKLDDSETISDHLFKVNADRYLPVNDELIPTGEERSVAETPFDYSALSPVSQASPVDHNFCLSRQRTGLRSVAWLVSPLSNLTMECRTTEPGLQIYDGGKINIDLPGLNGREMIAHAGLAMEPQIWPDANHHSVFPQALLRPGETYRQHTQFAFSKE
ncbi:galactose mutarotase [Aliiroseovarius sp. M344]|uniref:aldose epimerase family protein n=1 Tax=Aliiroseovarius sp. M344 TaxID=2867010 RepID=UPI0021AE26FC|nr:aldose epimerase family protein [Aliiroseovarius sp. M344]UWQ15374.1 galactose mutarotase [Aliiroseovarius sp. M344]